MNDEPEEIGIPEWVVTFGDMMSLLLTFFIMLVSLSEIKEEETYQALVDSIQQRFGYAKSLDSLSPGDSRPRTSAFNTLATVGRAKRKDTASGGVPQKAPTGEDPMVRIVRPGSMTAVGSVVFFELASPSIDAEGRKVLASLAEQLRGKPQKIEVRGHVSSQYAARVGGTGNAVMLGIQRAEAVRELLVEKHNLDPRRFRISSAADSEPMSRDGRAGKVAQNPRVEVFMLDETVEDLSGTSDERRSETITSDPAENAS
ncbi:MAG: flagellar motor protein MotB [Planctomycetota bacterium]